MPTSIDPLPAENEIECGRCGAYFHYELTRCPSCGVNLYEPESDSGPAGAQPAREGWLSATLRRLTQKPSPADELFGAAINQADLFGDLLTRVGGDRAAAERLVEFERQKNPQSNRTVWLRNAIQRWDYDNRTSGAGRERGNL
jgi:predicted  nucleic acid-binding Zn-ribbon protein